LVEAAEVEDFQVGAVGVDCQIEVEELPRVVEVDLPKVDEGVLWTEEEESLD
jgi:hypothetical protein